MESPGSSPGLDAPFSAVAPQLSVVPAHSLLQVVGKGQRLIPAWFRCEDWSPQRGG